MLCVTHRRTSQKSNFAARAGRRLRTVMSYDFCCSLLRVPARLLQGQDGLRGIGNLQERLFLLSIPWYAYHSPTSRLYAWLSDIPYPRTHHSLRNLQSQTALSSPDTQESLWQAESRFPVDSFRTCEHVHAKTYTHKPTKGLLLVVLGYTSPLPWYAYSSRSVFQSQR